MVTSGENFWEELTHWASSYDTTTNRVAVSDETGSLCKCASNLTETYLVICKKKRMCRGSAPPLNAYRGKHWVVSGYVNVHGYIVVCVCTHVLLQEASEPTKEEKAVAKYVRFNCPTKSTSMIGHRVDYFVGQSSRHLFISLFVARARTTFSLLINTTNVRHVAV